MNMFIGFIIGVASCVLVYEATNKIENILSNITIKSEIEETSTEVEHAL